MATKKIRDANNKLQEVDESFAELDSIPPAKNLAKVFQDGAKSARRAATIMEEALERKASTKEIVTYVAIGAVGTIVVTTMVIPAVRSFRRARATSDVQVETPGGKLKAVAH